MAKTNSAAANALTQPERVGDHPEGSLFVRGELSIRDALEEASVHLCSVIAIVRDAAVNGGAPVALHGAVTLAEIGKALVDAAAMAAMLAERGEVSNG
ncbi:DUF3077 domain-containing protein [Burkholderia orbicola]|uniref:DUF3077 domain-containing protein n=1 Tax=Burkholderia orbicola TaxID=2978683 RepID=UPI00265611CE|nr:DUF3077 domain-containing protein [Burkholderia orbicola]MDN7558192.1 DUF3077 domain-containing protein [Burkholderia orbicola]